MTHEPITDWAKRVIQKEMDRLSDSMEIRCPKCKYLFEGEDQESFITYDGEEGPIECPCPNCDCELIVEEEVTRTWEVRVKDGPGN